MRVLTLCGLFICLLILPGTETNREEKKDEKKDWPTVYTVERGDLPTKVMVGDTIPFYRSSTESIKVIKVEVTGGVKLTEARSVKFVNGKAEATETKDMVYDLKAEKKGKATVTIHRTIDGMPGLPEGYEIEITE